MFDAKLLTDSPEIVFPAAEIVLLVKVSLVFLPTSVSVDVGRVIVPVLLIVVIEGAVLNTQEPVIDCA